MSVIFDTQSFPEPLMGSWKRLDNSKYLINRSDSKCSNNNNYGLRDPKNPLDANFKTRAFDYFVSNFATSSHPGG